MSLKEIFIAEGLMPKDAIHSQQQEKQTILSKTERRIAGLTVYEQNTVTGEIKVAELQPIVVPAKTIMVFSSKIKIGGCISYDVVMKEDCRYVQALNKKNAIKKFNKLKK